MRQYRRLPLVGMQNARDLGGYLAEGGRQTAYGQFIRSEMPSRLTEGDLDFLRDYGVRLSIDFRGEDEIRRHPSRLEGLDWVDYVHLPAGDARLGHGAFIEQREEKLTVDWPAMYIGMVEGLKPWVRQVVELAADCPGAVHYHCTTGKDRTGLISMVLLGLCGVDELDIIADYAVSQIYLGPMFLHIGDVVRDAQAFDADDPFFRTEPRNMELLIRHVNGTYGSVEGYAKSCGIGEETILALREKLLD